MAQSRTDPPAARNNQRARSRLESGAIACAPRSLLDGSVSPCIFSPYLCVSVVGFFVEACDPLPPFRLSQTMAIPAAAKTANPASHAAPWARKVNLGSTTQG